jgi:pimeloyl-ACP methyl ester carboxylesterase
MILHGLFGSLDNWNTLARQFAEHRQVILVDQRNHGRSFHADEMNYKVMADDVVQLLDELGLSSVDLLGHSMGGKTAMTLALHYPQYVSKLIVADIGTKRYASHHDKILAALHAVPLDFIQNRSEAIEVMREFIEEEGVLQFLGKNLFWIVKGELAWRMNLQVIEDNMDKILAPLDAGVFEGSTLFLRGGKSGYILDSDLKAILEQFPKGGIETMPEAGHWLHAENPQLFYSLVTGFLN